MWRNSLALEKKSRPFKKLEYVYLNGKMGRELEKRWAVRKAKGTGSCLRAQLCWGTGEETRRGRRVQWTVPPAAGRPWSGDDNPYLLRDVNTCVRYGVGRTGNQNTSGQSHHPPTNCTGWSLTERLCARRPICDAKKFTAAHITLVCEPLLIFLTIFKLVVFLTNFTSNSDLITIICALGRS